MPFMSLSFFRFSHRHSMPCLLTSEFGETKVSGMRLCRRWFFLLLPRPELPISLSIIPCSSRHASNVWRCLMMCSRVHKFGRRCLLPTCTFSLLVERVYSVPIVGASTASRHPEQKYSTFHPSSNIACMSALKPCHALASRRPRQRFGARGGVAGARYFDTAQTPAFSEGESL